MDMLRVQAVWNGWEGAPGYSSFYFAGGGGLISDAQQVADRVATSFELIAGLLPSQVTVSIPTEVEVVDSDSGILSGYQPIDAPDPIDGDNVSTSRWSAPTGAVINWLTADVRFGRRIRGRTFLVPLDGSAYQADGTLGGDTLIALRAFADNLTSWDFDSEFGVWSRPRGGSGGVFASATGYRVPDMAAVLRSRRD